MDIHSWIFDIQDMVIHNWVTDIHHRFVDIHDRIMSIQWYAQLEDFSCLNDPESNSRTNLFHISYVMQNFVVF